MGAPGPSGGLFSSLRQLLGTVLEIGQVRLQLLGNELEQEKLRILDGLILAGIGLLLVGVGIVLLCILVLLLFSEGYRALALAVMTFSFIIGGVMLLRASGRRMQSEGGLFKATLGELAQDRAGLASPPRE